MTDFSERQVRIQIKDQIDRMKRKKQSEEYEWSGSEDEGGSLDPPTVKKHGGMCVSVRTLSRSDTSDVALQLHILQQTFQS